MRDKEYRIDHPFPENYIYPLSVFGQDEGYTIKYNPLPSGVPEGTPEGKGLYLTIYPELSPNTDIISF